MMTQLQLAGLIADTMKILHLMKFLKEIMSCFYNTKVVLTEDKTLGRARDPRANGAWLNKLTE